MEEKSSFCNDPRIKLHAYVKTEVRHQLAQRRNSILIIFTKWQVELWSCFLILIAFCSVLQCAPEDMLKAWTEHCFSTAVWDPSSNDTSNLFFLFRSKGTVILPHLLFPCTSCQNGVLVSVTLPLLLETIHMYWGKSRISHLPIQLGYMYPEGFFKQ